jgi:hypothetical protein
MIKKKAPPSQDYMKYWRVIRYYIIAKYKITTADLDILLFLYSEMYFGKQQFNEYDELLSWDDARFYKLMKDGWIVTFREKKGNKKALYELSYKARRMIGSLYKKLNGQEIPESQGTNPLFHKDASYQDKVYRNYIKEMNAFIRQQRHLSRQ